MFQKIVFLPSPLSFPGKISVLNLLLSFRRNHWRRQVCCTFQLFLQVLPSLTLFFVRHFDIVLIHLKEKKNNTVTPNLMVTSTTCRDIHIRYSIVKRYGELFDLALYKSIYLFIFIMKNSLLWTVSLVQTI